MERAHGRARGRPRRFAPVGERGPDVGHGAGDDHARLPCDTASRAVSVAPARRRRRGARGAVLGDRLAVALDRLPVAALDRAGELEAVLDHAPHQRVERLVGDARGGEQLAGGAAQRDQVVRCDRGARVVERAPVVVERRTAAARAPRRARSRPRAASSVSPVTAAQAPSSCSGPRSCVNVCSGCTEKRRTCGSSAASGVPPLTCATHGPGASRGRDLRDRAVGDAEQDELGAVVAQRRRRARRAVRSRRCRRGRAHR